MLSKELSLSYEVHSRARLFLHRNGRPRENECISLSVLSVAGS